VATSFTQKQETPQIERPREQTRTIDTHKMDQQNKLLEQQKEERRKQDEKARNELAEQRRQLEEEKVCYNM
jgi:vacuolar-type H+-ATPase subunit I/STV1